MYESNSEGEDDPMASGLIIPMTARVKVTIISLGSKGTLIVLLDLGCTRCLVSPQVVEKLGLRLRKLKKPTAFSQLDNLLAGEMPATCLTEPVDLKLGTHVQTIQFIVAPAMSNAMVLGLIWWRKWNHYINWDGVTLQMRRKVTS